MEELRIMLMMKGASELQFFFLDDSFGSNYFSRSFVRPCKFPVNYSICFGALKLDTTGGEDGFGIGNKDSA